MFFYLLCAAAVPLSVRAAEPLTDWLEGMTRAAVQAGRDPAAAAAGARTALAARGAGDAAARARLALGAALLAQRDTADAATELARAAEGLEDPRLREAARRLEAAARAPPLPLQAPPPPPASADDALARAELLLADARPRAALELLAGLEPLAPGAGASARADALRALALLPLGRPAEAEEAARRALSAGAADGGTVAAAELALARATGRLGRHAEAMEWYRRVAGGRVPVPGLPAAQQPDLADDASFLAVWLLYDAGRYAEAAPALRAWARAHPRARRADDARWFAAWSLVRLGDRTRARAALARLVPGPLEAPALYWLGRLSQGRKAQRALFRRALAAAGPDGWYGQLAAARLLALGAGVPRWPLPRGGPPGDGPGAGASGDALSRAAALLAAGLPGPARSELGALSGSRRVRAVAVRAAQLAEAAGDVELPARLARDHLFPSRRALRWSHPDAWSDRLPLLAARAGVDRFLLLAVLRRESGFRPEARSPAGAEGLLQLLPATAERFAVAAGLPADRPLALRDPGPALALGSLYLGLLQDRFRHPAAALAAYNAGPAATAPWTRRLAGQPLDEWVENLGFRETRRYVKAVLADAQVYRWLWAGGELLVDGLAPMPAAGEGVAF